MAEKNLKIPPHQRRRINRIVFLALRDGGLRCGKCKREFTGVFDKSLTIDHIRPIDRNGSDERDNLQLLCGRCNVQKANDWDGRSGTVRAKFYPKDGPLRALLED